jgi:methionine synthase II (cobalamin-independent)
MVRTTGVGSMPGTDSAEATRIVAGELDVPHVVELPARGPGGDMVGRTLGLVTAVVGDFAAETTPTGWRLAGGVAGQRPGRTMRLAASWLAEDLDRLEQQLDGFTGSVKVQVVGPWTLAAALESVRGTRLLADAGACADLAAALAETVAAHVAEVARRIPQAGVVVQLDEPSLPQVVAGGVRTPSGRGALRVPETPELSAALARVAGSATVAGARGCIAHCCAAGVPFELLAGSGFAGISVDSGRVGREGDAALGAWWDRGGEVILGVAPATDPAAGAERALPESMARAIEARWRRIGFGIADVGQRTWLSPSCGLAGASPAWARQVGAALRAAAGLLER